MNDKGKQAGILAILLRALREKKRIFKDPESDRRKR